MKERIINRNIAYKMLLLVAMAFLGVLVFTGVPEVRAQGEGTGDDPIPGTNTP